MRASFTLLALAAVVSAGSISRRQLPACAMQCMASADTGGCDPTDNTCMCNSAAFVTSTYQCVQQTCTDPSDLQAAIDGARALCAAAGVNLTETVPAATDPAASTDPVETSAAQTSPVETSAAATSAAATTSAASSHASATGSASTASRTSASSRPAGASPSGSASAAASPSASSTHNGAVGPAGVSGMVGVLVAAAGFMFAL
ncbi:hypothetical protein FRC10_005051 [Ceratobasidium sp. 414]|nr:hypothetical protein FRC10_005051 [Ceratobasidium sp. 414]